jgi:hypothetical protein
MKTFPTKYLSYLAILFAVLYFFSETWYHMTYDQSTIQLIADYMAIFLLLFAGSVHLKTSKGIGLLSGAWGYTFCIMYRAFAWRMDAHHLEHYEWVELYKIMAGLFVSFIAFVLTLIKTYPSKNSN